MQTLADVWAQDHHSSNAGFGGAGFGGAGFGGAGFGGAGQSAPARAAGPARWWQRKTGNPMSTDRARLAVAVQLSEHRL